MSRQHMSDNWWKQNTQPRSRGRGTSQGGASRWQVVSSATLTAAFGPDEHIGLDDAEWEEPSYDPHDEEEQSFLSLALLGDVDPATVLQRIETICTTYLSDIEADLVWLMRDGRRPVEISRILQIPECEVVRLRKNCFRKIKTVYLYDYHHDKQTFFAETIPLLSLSPKQARVFTMYYSYFGLRQIAETIGTRPSNVHRSLQMMKRKMETLLPETSPHRFYLGAFHDFKYLCLTMRDANDGAAPPAGA